VPAPPPLLPWSTVARNLPEHADNPVHTDEGARAAGFDAAIVAGTTVHAYLTHPAASAWGLDWLARGWSEVRFLAPVFDADTVDCVPIDNNLIEARVGGSVRATLAVALDAPTVGTAGSEQLPAMTVDLASGPATYGTRAGDDLEYYAKHNIAHPAVWSSIGNTITKANFVTGPWVHVRSAITHLAPAAADAIVTVESTVADRFSTRAGDRVVLDIRVRVGELPVAVIEHESIIRLATG
jgi:acyl dehydratase